MNLNPGGVWSDPSNHTVLSPHGRTRPSDRSTASMRSTTWAHTTQEWPPAPHQTASSGRRSRKQFSRRAVCCRSRADTVVSTHPANDDGDTFVSNETEVVNVADIDRIIRELEAQGIDPQEEYLNRERSFASVNGYQPKGIFGGSGLDNQLNPVSGLVSQVTGNLTHPLGHFQTTLNQLASTGQHFVDQSFSTGVEALAGWQEGGKPVSFYEELEWLEPKMFFGPNYTVMKDSCDMRDLKQGALGDCYLLSAIAAIAEYPERIERILATKQMNREGIYGVNFCLNGIWQEVVIDDAFPCKKSSRKPAFCTSESKELWPMIIEKAWAKIHRGYNNIISGLMRETLKDLTGAPCITIFSKDNTPDSHWNNLVDADLNRHIMGCASSDLKKSGDDSADTSTGLSGNHAYTLIGVLEIITREGEPRVKQPHEFSDPSNIRLVKLRNPWGKGEWTGDWSDRSPLWTPRLRAEANMVDRDDGIFYMPFDQWLVYFRDYQICYYHDGFQYSSKMLTSMPCQYKYITFELTAAGDYYFTTNQPNKRLFKKAENYVYSPLAMFLGVANQQGGFSYVGSICKADKEMWFKAACQPGVYCAMIYTPWVTEVNEFSFSTYGPQATNITELSGSQIPPNFLENIVMSKALKEPETLKNYQDQNQPSIYYKFESGSDSIGYFYFLNHTYDTNLEVTVTFTKFTDSEVLPPYTQANPKIAVPAGEQGLLLYRLNGPKAKVSFKTAATFKKAANAQTHDPDALPSSFLPKSSINRRAAPPEAVAHPDSIASPELAACITPEQIKSQGQWAAKVDEFGNNYDMYSYLLQHEHGTSLYYENNTDEFILDEDITFDLRDCKIEGISGSAAKVRVGPRQSSLVNIIRTGPSFSAQVTYCTYQIFRA